MLGGSPLAKYQSADEIRRNTVMEMEISASSPAEVIETIDDENEIRANYATMSDGSQALRDAWVEKCFPKLRAFPFNPDGSNVVSRAECVYDAILVGGPDIPRAIKFLKNFETITQSVMKIAILNNSNASKRAKLLNAGFDDVFDISKISIKEAQARALSMHARYEAARISLNVENSLNYEISKISDVHLMSKREKYIVESFLNSHNFYISYERLQQIIFNYRDNTYFSHDDKITFNNLKVIVSNLRRKLKQNVKLKSKYNQGYELIILQ